MLDRMCQSYLFLLASGMPLTEIHSFWALNAEIYSVWILYAEIHSSWALYAGIRFMNCHQKAVWYNFSVPKDRRGEIACSHQARHYLKWWKNRSRFGYNVYSLFDRFCSLDFKFFIFRILKHVLELPSISGQVMEERSRFDTQVYWKTWGLCSLRLLHLILFSGYCIL